MVKCSACAQIMCWECLCTCYSDEDFIAFIREQQEIRREPRATHKAFTAFVGQGLYLPLCGQPAVWDSNTKVKRNWKDVTCPECLKHKPKKGGE